MTNKEAIKIIQMERNHCASHNQDIGKSDEYHKEMQDMVEAFDIAINSLKEQITDEEIQADMMKAYFGGQVKPDAKDGWRYEE